MSPLGDSAAFLSAGFLATHLVGIVLAGWRSRPMRRRPVPEPAPGVTLVRPLCGMDHDARAILGATFQLDYPNYEVLFCVERSDDPVLPLVRELVAGHPHVDAQILIGTDRISDNPKLNNMVKGWRAARHDWVCFTDSNLMIPADYIQRLLSSWRKGTGCVSAPPVGGEADGLWAEVECAFLNTYQARWQFAVDTLGFGFAQGKNLFFRKSDLASAGGIAALACEPAEDAAATKVVRGLGKGVRLVDPPFVQPLGRRTLRSVWNRQVRWARLRRSTFPFLFIPEILTGSLVPLIATGCAAYAQDVSVPATLAIYAGLWYGAEAALTLHARWQFTVLTPLAWLLRDFSLPALWGAGLAGRSFVWRSEGAESAGEAATGASG